MASDETVFPGPAGLIAKYTRDKTATNSDMYIVEVAKPNCVSHRTGLISDEMDGIMKLAWVYTAFAELGAQALREILLDHRDRCGVSYGELYAVSEWLAGFLRSAVSFMRHRTLYNIGE